VQVTSPATFCIFRWAFDLNQGCKNCVVLENKAASFLKFCCIAECSRAAVEGSGSWRAQMQWALVSTSNMWLNMDVLLLLVFMPFSVASYQRISCLHFCSLHWCTLYKLLYKIIRNSSLLELGLVYSIAYTVHVNMCSPCFLVMKEASLCSSLVSCA